MTTDQSSREATIEVPDGPRFAYSPADLTLGYYVIERNHAGDRFRYVWIEGASDEPADRGRWFDLVSRALRDAADNWDEAGSGGRLSATLRAAATRAEKKEQSA